MISGDVREHERTPSRFVPTLMPTELVDCEVRKAKGGVGLPRPLSRVFKLYPSFDLQKDVIHIREACAYTIFDALRDAVREKSGTNGPAPVITLRHLSGPQ